MQVGENIQIDHMTVTKNGGMKSRVANVNIVVEIRLKREEYSNKERKFAMFLCVMEILFNELWEEYNR